MNVRVFSFNFTLIVSCYARILTSWLVLLKDREVGSENLQLLFLRAANLGHRLPTLFPSFHLLSFARRWIFLVFKLYLLHRRGVLLCLGEQVARLLPLNPRVGAFDARNAHLRLYWYGLRFHQRFVTLAVTLANLSGTRILAFQSEFSISRERT